MDLQKTQKALVLNQYGKNLILIDFPMPVPQEGDLLIKVEGSTINPSDRMRLKGVYLPVKLPAVMGIEGTGRVVQAKGSNIQHWVGKRVCFIHKNSGSWGQFALSLPNTTFEIDEDVPLTTAASGIVNPLTVIGMVEIFKDQPNRKGLIHTAAASALGRQLNKYCQTLGIPLLNIVRRKQQKQLLINEGAAYVIVTDEGWLQDYKIAIKEFGFNVLFDALGGGQVTETLIVNLPKKSIAYIYGILEGKPFILPNPLKLYRSINVTAYMVFTWWEDYSIQKQNEIKAKYSQLLKTDLKTHSLKVLKYSQIEEALELSVSKATEGKITLVPN